ncbi:MAG: hypothetical protein D8M57_15405 [Candidatus Scalindua sp. AMX11]|nr:MAG: hypothetical protein DWQ00_02245 [Candidatus Scalindua sp.]TDE64037.1 MAG: hypothetical protein D8M57_15405 [Candidatus Scalindua sp. AMX11]GJQ60907.1 MAG: hypothetical protein SCALA701_37080 [Candidatus Scalindua sp.]
MAQIAKNTVVIENSLIFPPAIIPVSYLNKILKYKIIYEKQYITDLIYQIAFFMSSMNFLKFLVKNVALFFSQ